MGIKGEHQNDERSKSPSRFDAHFFYRKIHLQSPRMFLKISFLKGGDVGPKFVLVIFRKLRLQLNKG